MGLFRFGLKSINIHAEEYPMFKTYFVIAI